MLLFLGPGGAEVMLVSKAKSVIEEKKSSTPAMCPLISSVVEK